MILTVNDAAKILNISPTRVRKLISDSVLSAKKIGNAWLLEEKDVIQRKIDDPKPGRPKSGDSVSLDSDDCFGEIDEQQIEKAHELYSACKEYLSVIPDSKLLTNAESAEEASFYVAVSDFFLQQKQYELIKQGVY